MKQEDMKSKHWHETNMMYVGILAFTIIIILLVIVGFMVYVTMHSVNDGKDMEVSQSTGMITDNYSQELLGISKTPVISNITNPKNYSRASLYRYSSGVRCLEYDAVSVYIIPGGLDGFDVTDNDNVVEERFYGVTAVQSNLNRCIR